MSKKASKEVKIPKKVLVVDDDVVVTRLVVKILEDLGVAEIDVLHDGQEAWEAIEKTQYGGIFLDWKLPSITGLTLFNRIRSIRNYRHIPILAISGFLHKEDFKILTEFACTDLLEKPFSAAALKNKFTNLLEKSEWKLENAKKIVEMMNSIADNPKKNLKKFYKFVDASPDPISQLVTASRVISRKKMYKSAEKLIRKALELDKQHIVALTELGKVLHWQKRHVDAARALSAANYLCPHNMERLLFLGEVHLAEISPEKAKATFDKALEIDSANPLAKAGQSTANDIIEFMDDKTIDTIPLSYASLINVIAIAKVRSGKHAEGVGQYKSALSFIHDPGSVSKVQFNLGLAFMRSKKLEEAKEWFKRSAEIGGEIFSKASQYVELLNANEIGVFESGGSRSSDDLMQCVDEASDYDFFGAISDEVPEAGDDFGGDEKLFESLPDSIGGAKSPSKKQVTSVVDEVEDDTDDGLFAIL